MRQFEGGGNDVIAGGLWCIEGGHREGSVMHVEGVHDARCGSFMRACDVNEGGLWCMEKGNGRGL